MEILKIEPLLFRQAGNPPPGASEPAPQDPTKPSLGPVAPLQQLPPLPLLPLDVKNMNAALDSHVVGTVRLGVGQLHLQQQFQGGGASLSGLLPLPLSSPPPPMLGISIDQPLESVCIGKMPSRQGGAQPVAMAAAAAAAAAVLSPSRASPTDPPAAITGAGAPAPPPPLLPGRRRPTAGPRARRPRPAPDAPRSSSFRGVTKHRRSGRFEAHIWVKELGRQVYLGGYEAEAHAAEAYDIVALKSKGPKTKLNFEVSKYADLLGCIDRMKVEELVMAVRRQSQGFSRGTSAYRGVTKHPSGRWEARIGIPGSKHVYLGLHTDEATAAKAYDCALVRLRGPGAATNFSAADYRKETEDYNKMQAAVAANDPLVAAMTADLQRYEQWVRNGAEGRGAGGGGGGGAESDESDEEAGEDVQMEDGEQDTPGSTASARGGRGASGGAVGMGGLGPAALAVREMGQAQGSGGAATQRQLEKK